MSRVGVHGKDSSSGIRFEPPWEISVSIKRQKSHREGVHERQVLLRQSRLRLPLREPREGRVENDSRENGE